MTVNEALATVARFEEEARRRGDDVYAVRAPAREGRTHEAPWELGDAWRNLVTAAQVLKAQAGELLRELDREVARSRWPINGSVTVAPTRLQDEWMPFDDACNVTNVTGDEIVEALEAVSVEQLRTMRAAAGALAMYVAAYEAQLSATHARGRAAARADAAWVEGQPLVEGKDTGGRRDYLGERPVHAGSGLYLLTDIGWLPVRYEFDHALRAPVLYIAVPGGGEAPMRIPAGARFAWPHEVRPLNAG